MSRKYISSGQEVEVKCQKENFTKGVSMQNNPIKNFTTAEVGRLLGVQANTIRRSLCINGHYLGLQPIKLPNNRLLWPADAVYQLFPEKAGRPQG
jgi:hypothetical protein